MNKNMRKYMKNKIRFSLLIFKKNKYTSTKKETKHLSNHSSRIKKSKLN